MHLLNWNNDTINYDDSDGDDKRRQPERRPTLTSYSSRYCSELDKHSGLKDDHFLYQRKRSRHNADH